MTLTEVKSLIAKKEQLVELTDAIAAMQSLDDLGSPEANQKAWDDMLELQKRHEKLRKEIDELEAEDVSPPLQIDTDGRTVWVNAPLCVARFCFHSGEVVKQNPCCAVGGRHSSSEFIHPANWEKWKAKVKEFHDIDVPDKYKPEWCDAETR
jgi:hypothetical protein